MTDQDKPNGAAQQRPPEEITPQVKRSFKEETKDPEPYQTVRLAGGDAMSAPSLDAPPMYIMGVRVNQPIESIKKSADANQATLQAFSSILAQQLREQREHSDM